MQVNYNFTTNDKNINLPLEENLNKTELIHSRSPFNFQGNSKLHYDYSVSRSRSKSYNKTDVRNIKEYNKKSRRSKFSNLSRSKLNFSYTSDPDLIELNDSGAYLSNSKNKYNSRKFNNETNKEKIKGKAYFSDFEYDSTNNLAEENPLKVNKEYDINIASNEILVHQVNDLRKEITQLRDENRSLQLKLLNLSTVEKAKKQINHLEKNLEYLTYEGKCVEIIKELSSILVSIN